MNVLQIEIGKAEIFKDRDRIIKIVLGSCVGVVLFDEEKRIFGAIHILLPRYSKIYRNEYAITAFANPGLKYLVNQMSKFCNTTEKLNLQAVVAGGAELGAKSVFNVGKHNCKETLKFLTKHNIPIIAKDCLKEYPRSLQFNTKNLSVEFINIKEKPLSPTIKRYSRTLFIKEIFEYFSYLSIPNSIAMQLIKLRDKKDLKLSEIENIVKRDDTLTIDLLKYVNSPYFARAKKITTIREALTVLGLKKFFNFISNQILNGFVKSNLDSYMIDERSYKLHVLCVAMLSESIADIINEDSTKAYMAGLFHDIGKIILDKYAMDKYDIPNRKELINFIEDSIKTSTHACIGAEFLKTIGFEEEIIEAVFYHHFPLQSQQKHRKLSCVVAAANILISNYIVGTDNYQPSLTLDDEKAIFSEIELDSDTLEAIIGQIGYFFKFAEETIDEVQ